MASRGGCGRSVGCLVVLLLLAAGAWLARDEIGAWMGRFEIGAGAEPSEELAREAEEKLDEIAREGLDDERRFSEAELQSLLTYRSGPVLPPGIEDPRIDVQDSVVIVSARVRPSELEGIGTPEALQSILSDTSRIIVGLEPVVERPGELLVRVRSLQAGTVVIPPPMLPLIVGGLAAEGLHTSGAAVVVPMPRELGAVSIDGDDIVLLPASASPPAEAP